MALRLAHPYNAITENNADSVAHNIISGSAFSAPGGHQSEYKRVYATSPMPSAMSSPRVPLAPSSKGKPFGGSSFGGGSSRFGQTSASDNPGLRSEEMITVGQYTPVLRSYN